MQIDAMLRQSPADLAGSFASMSPARSFDSELIRGYWNNHLIDWFGSRVDVLIAVRLYSRPFLPKPDPAGAGA